MGNCSPKLYFILPRKDARQVDQSKDRNTDKEIVEVFNKRPAHLLAGIASGRSAKELTELSYEEKKPSKCILMFVNGDHFKA